MPIYRFADFRFDPDRLVLTRAGKPIAAQPRVLEMLAFLVARRDRTVTRDEMAETLWNREIVSEDAITKRIGLLRKALGDTDRERRFIQTSYGRGARFIGLIETERAEVVSDVASTDAMSAGNPGSPPSLIVLPFRTSKSRGRIAEIGIGLPDDITSSLVKLRSMKVIARGTAFRYAPLDTALADLRRDLDVGYALSGQVEADGPGLQIYTELVSTRDEAVVWSETYRIAANEIHTLRDELVGRIVNRAEIAIPVEEASRAALSMPSQIDAWAAYHRGITLGIETLDPDYPRAGIYLNKAIEQVPDFARARAALAFIYWNFFNENIEQELNRDRMLAEAEKAVAISPSDPMSQVALGTLLGSIGDIEGGKRHVGRAIELAPNLARAHAAMGGLATAQGQVADSIAMIDHAAALSPRDPHLSRWLSIKLVDHLLLGELDYVRFIAGEIERIGPGQISALGWALAGFSLAGDKEAAERVASHLRATIGAQRVEGIPASYSSLPPILKAILTEAFTKFGLIQ